MGISRQCGMLLALAAFLAAGATGFAQQQFQFAYGGALNDGARGGVIAANDGGYIAVGETRSFPGGANPNYNVYVVKTDACGNVQWANAYDIGGDDFGRRIQSVPTGGYIIVGSTQVPNACSGNDIFLLKLLDDGRVDWARTYGGMDVDEGWDVRVMLGLGNAVNYVVAGGTRSFNVGSNGTSMDAFLLRTDQGGVPVWGRVYGTRYAEYFRTCLVTANSEIVAAGAMQVSGAPQNDTDIVAVRVDGNGTLLWANRYGLTTSNEDAWRLVELAPQDGGNLVLVGHTTTAVNSGDGLAMVLSPAGGFVQARVFGSPGWDEFRDIQLDPSISSLMVITGYFDNGVRGKDVFVCEILPALQFGPRMIYGGTRDDLGWGVVAVVEGDHTESVVAGVTSSFGAGGEDLYLLKVNQDSVHGCNDAEPVVSSPAVVLKQVKLSVCESNIMVSCKGSVTVYPAVGSTAICECDPQAEGRNMPAGLSLRDGTSPDVIRMPAARPDANLPAINAGRR